MISQHKVVKGLILLTAGALLAGSACAAPGPAGRATARAAAPRSAAAVHPAVAYGPVAKLPTGMNKRWLFVWRDMSDPKEVDRVIARLPQARQDGYNGVAISANVAPARAAALKAAAQANGFQLVAMVMGGAKDRNYMEGVLSKDALFVVQNGAASLQPDNPTQVVNGDFENANGNHFVGWGFQDDEGVTTFADHDVVHDGKTSLRIENVGKNQFRHARIAQPLKLQPHRQYRISFWLKTENLSPADPEVKVLAPDPQGAVSFQTFHADKTQDWTHYDLVFNSLNSTDVTLYLGSWYGKEGKMWWDGLKVEEIGLVNVLRRPGCPVTVRSDAAVGTTYEEGRDYEKIVDPLLHPWQAYHEPPVIKLTANSRIHDGDRLRVSYYHPIIVYEDRLTSCLSEPKIFDEWREEVKAANDLYHPDAFLMEHDEMRVINQCALCQSKHMTPGELLAWNIHQSAQSIRDIRPDAEIWVWSDMFDPYHNAVDHFFAVNGPLAGSWKGLDPGIGIVNWNGGGLAKDVQFFSDLGLKQILSGYYDGDDDGSGIARWEESAKGIPGVVGAMYTTWEDKYGPMDVWAQKAWGGGKAQ